MAQEKRSDRIIAQSVRERLKDERVRRAAPNILEPAVISGDKYLREMFRTVYSYDKAGNVIRERRQITNDDLRKFKQNITNARSRFTKAGFKGGIAPQTIVDLSRSEDRKLAHTEITTASPLRKDGQGLAVFRTNASAKYGKSHHIVSVRFLNFPAVVSAGRMSKALINEVIKGQVKFDCDCGRHRFWYRYIATIGGFAEGTPESGFPKIRNPNLRGVACKHVLRVMAIITQSPSFKVTMEQWINRYRADPTQKQQHVKAKDREDFESRTKLESWRQRRVATSQEKGLKPRGKAVKPVDLSKRKRAEMEKTMSKADIKKKALIELEAAFKAGAISKSTYELIRKDYA